jgi:hypothetical protein
VYGSFYLFAQCIWVRNLCSSSGICRSCCICLWCYSFVVGGVGGEHTTLHNNIVNFHVYISAWRWS